jgi:hypothetical protein
MTVTRSVVMFLIILLLAALFYFWWFRSPSLPAIPPSPSGVSTPST